MRCSKDIRKRVLSFVGEGGSKAEAARRFEVSRASVYNWLSKSDGLSYEKPGPRKPHKLDWQALRKAVEQHPERMLKEHAKQFGVSTVAIWKACERMKLTHKKTRGATRKRRTINAIGAGT
jgi:putative transposase